MAGPPERIQIFHSPPYAASRSPLVLELPRERERVPHLAHPAKGQGRLMALGGKLAFQALQVPGGGSAEAASGHAITEASRAGSYTHLTLTTRHPV